MKDVDIFIDSVNNQNSSIKVMGVDIKRVSEFEINGKGGEPINVLFKVAPIVSAIKFNDANVRYVHVLDYMDNDDLNKLKEDIDLELEKRSINTL